MRRLIKKDAFKDFTKRGVPPGVLLQAYPENIQRYMTTIEIPKRGEEPVVIHDKTKQLASIDGFKKILAEDIRSNERLMVISSRDYDHLPNQLALSLAAFAFENGREFYWHSVYGGLQDDLRDDKATADDKLKKCSLLIISNLAANATANKIEKVRDLLTRYSDKNRIIVNAGVPPLDFCKNILFMKSDAMISF